MKLADMIDDEFERARGDGRMERVIIFLNKRRARVVNYPSGYTVQLLDCRNDEHEERLFKMREGMTAPLMEAALSEIAALPAPTRHKYDR